jgi:hypothetical protein
MDGMGGIGESLLVRLLDRPRFPRPWSVEEVEACFIVRDADGQGLAYLYFEDEPAGQTVTKLHMRNEAQRIATNIANICADNLF